LTNETSTNGQEFSLAAILNILWRRRWIVLGFPLLGLVLGIAYGIFGTERWAATATIRPGITAFGPDGGPFRQWQLKDITRYYEQMLYRKELVSRLGLAKGARPVIRAEFIAQGLQNLQGGDVITLWTTATSPELAASILDTAMVLFEEYAETDSVSSQLKLTEDGLKLQIRGLEIQLAGIDGEAASLELSLEHARAESLMVVAEDQKMALDLDKLAEKQAYYVRRLVDLQETEPRLANDLTLLDHALRRLSLDGAEDVEPAEVPDWARRSATLEGGDMMQALASAKMQVQTVLSENRALQDSMAYAAEVTRLGLAQLEIRRETHIRAKIREAGLTIGDLVLARQYELPAKRLDIKNQINERVLKLGTLSPLQRLGTTEVSEKPVRPRKLRALMILVLLGGMGGLVLAFTWDYLMSHRQEIFRS